MNVKELLGDLERKGFQLTPLPEGKLAVNPASKLSDELREELKLHKAELLLLLTHPYISERGELIIPFTADPKYLWWKGGQSIAETLQELNAPADVWRRYVEGYTEVMQ